MQTTTIDRKRYRDGWFDDAFEVIYENELPDRDASPDTESKKDQAPVRKNPADPARQEPVQKQKPQKSRGGSVRTAVSSAGKVLKAGGKAVRTTVQAAGRAATLFLIILITFLLAREFWQNCQVYGNPAAIIAEHNYTLAAYGAFALALLAFEVITFFWAMTGPYVSENRRMYRADTGRGMFSFLLVGAGSWAASVFAGLVPSSPVFLTGLSGALAVYGSLAQVLLVLCIAGVISCLVRKFTQG